MRASPETGRAITTTNIALTRLLGLLFALLAAISSEGALGADAATQLLAAAQRGDEARVLQLKTEFDSKPKPARGDKKTARALNEEALKLLRSGDFSTAIERLTVASKADSGDAEVLGNLGYAYLMIQRFSDAKTALERALELAPTRSATWGNLGEAHAGLGDEAAAIAALRLAYHFSRNREKTIAYFTLLIEKPAAPEILISAAKKAREVPALAVQATPSNLPSGSGPSYADLPESTTPTQADTSSERMFPAPNGEKTPRPSPPAAANNATFLAAVERGDVEKVRSYLGAGANPNARAANGYTALMVAADVGQYDVAKLLLAAGADVNAKLSDGTSALLLSSENNRPFIFEMLLQSGASRAGIEIRESAPYQKLLDYVRSGNKSGVRNQIASGAKINSPLFDHKSALMHASQQGNADMVWELLSLGASVHVRDDEGNTALILAAEQGHYFVVKALLSKGALVDAVNRKGISALMRAAKNGHVSIMMDLIDEGAQVDARGPGSKTALMMACMDGRDAAAQLLIDRGADVNAKNEVGEAPLLFASAGGHSGIVQLLLEKGADVNARANDGETACGIGSHHKAVAKLLLAKNAICPQLPTNEAENRELEAARRETYEKYCAPTHRTQIDKCMDIRQEGLAQECLKIALRMGVSCMERVEKIAIDTWRRQKR